MASCSSTLSTTICHRRRRPASDTPATTIERVQFSPASKSFLHHSMLALNLNSWSGCCHAASPGSPPQSEPPSDKFPPPSKGMGASFSRLKDTVQLPQNRKIVKPFNIIHPTYRFQKKPASLTLTKTNNSTSFHFTTDAENPPFTGDDRWDFPNDGIEEDADVGCSWEGAVMYRRNAAVSHLEYCSTLESLGLGKVSSEVSKGRASEMGLRVVNSVKDYPNGTPVLISVDVTRKKQKLRLDGIVRTVISLGCNRCGEPAAQSVYSDFTLLLCEEPIQEPETINMGTIFAGDKFRTLRSSEEADDDDDSMIDLDDQLYFPLDRKVIDISKNIRDLIHVEITINALCDPNCKGMCLKCGKNFNTSSCSCKTQQVDEKRYGPLGDLRKEMQET